MYATLLCVLFLFNVVSTKNVFNPPNIQILSHNFTYALSTKGRIIDINTGSVLHLKCSGDNAIIWKYPETNKGRSDTVNLTHSCDSSENGTVCDSDLLIKQLSFDATGEYSCFYNNSNDEHNFDSIYIFVNDENNLIVGVKEHTIWYSLNPIVIPCLPTFSSSNVSFQYSAIDSEERTNTAINEEEGISFDPTLGLVIQKFYLSSAVKFYCEVKVGNSKPANMEFIVVTGTKSVDNFYDSFELTSKTPILVNDTLEMCCKVDSSEQKQLSFDFVYPSSTINATITEINNETLELNSIKFYRYSRRLVIHKVSTEMQGVYFCNISDDNKLVASEFQNVAIYDESSQRINEMVANIDLSTTLVKKTGEDLRITFTPKSNFYVQFDDIYLLKDENVINKNDRKHQIRVKGVEIILEMKNLTVNESGIYTLMVRKSHNSVNMTINVEVKAKPQIVIESDSMEYKKNSEFQIVCRASGIPMPTIDAYFSPCDDVDCMTLKRKRITKFSTVLDGNREVYTTSINTKSTTLIIRAEAKQSGIYSCLAKSVSGNQYAFLTIKVLGDNSGNNFCFNILLNIIALIIILLIS